MGSKMLKLQISLLLYGVKNAKTSNFSAFVWMKMLNLQIPCFCLGENAKTSNFSAFVWGIIPKTSKFSAFV